MFETLTINSTAVVNDFAKRVLINVFWLYSITKFPSDGLWNMMTSSLGSSNKSVDSPQCPAIGQPGVLAISPVVQVGKPGQSWHLAAPAGSHLGLAACQAASGIVSFLQIPPAEAGLARSDQEYLVEIEDMVDQRRQKSRVIDMMYWALGNILPCQYQSSLLKCKNPVEVFHHCLGLFQQVV